MLTTALDQKDRKKKPRKMNICIYRDMIYDNGMVGSM